jgi:hypothetical protein
MGRDSSDLQKEILLLCLENKFLTCQDILHQVFGGREYDVAHASLSRTSTGWAFLPGGMSPQHFGPWLQST